MSRRKLGSRPKHLTAIQDDVPESSDSAATAPLVERSSQPEVSTCDEGRDLLTCGQCGQAFPLAHILAFIQHKQGGCRSRSHAPNANAPPSPANRAQPRRTNTSRGEGCAQLRVLDRDKSWGEEHNGKVKAEPNRTAEEPSGFICQQCEDVFPSAWALLQHAQHTHSFSIYQEEEAYEEVRGGGGGRGASRRLKPPTATLDPRHLSQTLASAFQPSASRPHHHRQSDGSISARATSAPSSRDQQALNFSVLLRELAEGSGGTSSAALGLGPSPSLSPPAASPFPQGGFPCELCGQGFLSLRSLSAHRRTHACERPYHCGLCDQAFSQSGQLARHMRSHRREAGGGGGAGAAGGGGFEGIDMRRGAMEEEDGKQGVRAGFLTQGAEGGDGVVSSDQGNAELDMTLPKHLSNGSGLVLTPPQSRGSNRSLLRLFQPQREGGEAGEDETEGQGETQHASPCASPSEGSLESGETGGSGESGIASGNCTPKRPERDERGRAVGEWEGEMVDGERDWNADINSEVIHSWQRESEQRSGGGNGNTNSSSSSISGKKKRDEACEFCGKQFRNSSNLTVHRRSHTGERPYRCGLCSYACAQSSKLTRHMKTHGVRGARAPFLCQLCKVPFTVYATLEKHLKKVHGLSHASVGAYAQASAADASAAPKLEVDGVVEKMEEEEGEEEEEQASVDQMEAGGAEVDKMGTQEGQEAEVEDGVSPARLEDCVKGNLEDRLEGNLEELAGDVNTEVALV